MKNFTFNKEGHYYELDGKRMYGVTTVLGVIAKPALIPWAVKTCVDYIKEHANIVYTDKKLDHYEITPQQLDEAKSAHRKKKEDAGAKGTDAHAIIEGAIKAAIQINNGYVINNGDMPEQVQHFLDWAIKNNIQFLASEKQVYSENAWVAGTTDMVFVKDGKKYVGDVKTSSAIYTEHFYQMAAYRMMLEEMGETDFEGSAVIRIGKDGKFNESKDVQWRYDYQTDLNAFLGALAIFKAGESYKQIK